MKSAQYRAYSIATRTVAKTRQIVMLYDGAIRFIRQAQVAIDESRIEDRFNLLKRASNVMMGLQSCIDFENGGEVAHILQGFYVDIANRVLAINFDRTNGRAMCDEVIKDIKQMRDVWDNIDQALSAQETPAPAATGIAAVQPETAKQETAAVPLPPQTTASNVITFSA